MIRAPASDGLDMAAGLDNRRSMTKFSMIKLNMRVKANNPMTIAVPLATTQTMARRYTSGLSTIPTPSISTLFN
jgi:hypothetical protein